jgi:hypothetical protein
MSACTAPGGGEGGAGKNAMRLHFSSIKREIERWNTDCTDDTDAHGSVKIRAIRVIRVLFIDGRLNSSIDDD